VRSRGTGCSRPGISVQFNWNRIELDDYNPPGIESAMIVCSDDLRSAWPMPFG
jgi:hypothetical protein